MRPKGRRPSSTVPASALMGVCLLLFGCHLATRQEAATEQGVRQLEALPVEYMQVQGLRRAVRFYRPDRLAERPAVVVVLHGGSGDGDRFRRFTYGAFERVADEQGFFVAYPDALGRQWNGCRSRALYHTALSGIDELAFLRAVVRRAAEMAAGDLAGVFAVGFSNGGHLVFRIALDAPHDFDALAAIGAHLPVFEERDCTASDMPVSMLLVSGTDDPINPWAGGEVRPPGGGTLGHVLSAEATVAYFAGLAGTVDGPTIEQHPDRDVADGAQVETRRWVAEGRGEVVLMAVHGGGHTLPHPTAPFPIDLVGRTSRDLDGADEIWSFFARHLEQD